MRDLNPSDHHPGTSGGPTRVIIVAALLLAAWLGVMGRGLADDDRPPVDYPADQVVGLWPIPEPEAGRNAWIKRKKNISRILREDWPSIEFYFPGNRVPESPRPAVLVFPGGAYVALAYDLEGVEIARWLNSHGIVVGVVRYSVPGRNAIAFLDTQRAISLTRHRAGALGIDPQGIGMLGFSAGGHLVARLAGDWQARLYPAVDEADSVSLRPDFVALVYPAYLSPRREVQLNPGIVVRADNPPVFMVQAKDDRKYVNSSLAYHEALVEHGVDVEFHLLDDGGHGFGIRVDANHPAGPWPELFVRWLDTLLAQ